MEPSSLIWRDIVAVPLSVEEGGPILLILPLLGATPCACFLAAIIDNVKVGVSSEIVDDLFRERWTNGGRTGRGTTETEGCEEATTVSAPDDEEWVERGFDGESDRERRVAEGDREGEDERGTAE